MNLNNPDKEAFKIKLQENSDLITVDSKPFNITLEELYKISSKYYRELQNNPLFSVPYHEKLRFLALFKQVKFGCFTPEACDYGWLNFTGSDTRKEWQKISNYSKNEAMLEFVNLLGVVCPNYNSFIENQDFICLTKPKIVKETLEQLNVNDLNTTLPFDLPNSTTLSIAESAFAEPEFESEEHRKLYQEQKKRIQEALNKETYHQFKAYAQHTLPGEPEKQEEYIKAIQELHYQRYMAQVYSQQSKAINADIENGTLNSNEAQQNGVKKLQNELSKLTIENEDEKKDIPSEVPANDDDNDGNSSIDNFSDLPSNPAISPASMWNRKNINEFKESVKKEGTEGIFKISHGETVTIRVPTHEEGSSIFWEFATDWYDLGFGMFFEWSKPETTDITIQVSESSDEEDESDEYIQSPNNETERKDVEGGVLEGRKKNINKPPVDMIIPIYRRDCHEEVFAGSHVYPGKGIYLLKFDNSYSLWRSKTLYYKVYYSK
uniref:ACB domain-containing protein n=1 Tax=Strongyloides stercoralis TaxID=6248 RepID=A0AAF5I2F8_STRER